MIYKIIDKISPSLLYVILKILRLVRSNKKDKLTFTFLIEFPECYLTYEPIMTDLIKRHHKVSVFIYTDGYIKQFDRDELSFPLPAGVVILDSMPKKFGTLILHNPYDLDRLRTHSFFNLYQRSHKVCFISYGIEVAGGRADTHYRLPAMRYSDFVLAPSERIYLNHMTFSGMNLNKKRLIKSQHSYLRQATLLSNSETPVYDVMYSIHHSIDKDNDLCTFAKYGVQILEILQRETHLSVIFRPHPLFLQKIATTNHFDTYNDLIQLNNVTVSTKNDFLSDIVSSKKVITDVSSLVPVINAANKNVLVLSNNQKNMESSQHMHREYSSADLKKFLTGEMDFEGYNDDTFYNNFSIVDKICVE